MKLSNDRFYSCKVLFRMKDGNAIPKEGMLYTYESGKAIYDVAVLLGEKTYQKNMGGFFHGEEHRTKYHAAVERHFDL